MRATVSYTDGHGAGKSASAVTALPVGVTARVLAKNTDQRSTGSQAYSNALVTLTAGSSPGGYGLSRVGIEFVSGTVTSPGAVEIKEYDNDQTAGDTLAVLVPPESLQAGAVNYFTVPAPAGLRLSGKFMLSLADTTSIQLAARLGSVVDDGHADGWNIATAFYHSTGLALVRPRIVVEGFELLGRPGPPLSVAASAGTGEVMLSWSAPDSDGHRPVTKYQVRHRREGGFFLETGDWSDVADSDGDSELDDERSLTVSGLAGGTVHVFQVRAVNSLGDGAEAEVKATPRSHTAPMFAAVDYPGGAASRSVAENAMSGDVGLPIIASDADGDSLTYSVAATGESDAAAHLADFNRDFELDTASGQVSVKAGASIDFEDRSSYVVSYRVTDGEDAAGTAEGTPVIDDTVTLTVSVTNVDEAGAVTLSGTAQVGEVLTASVSDPDGSVSGEVWQWSKASTMSGTFTDISGAMSASYTVLAADEGEFLKAAATYVDGFGSGRSASATSAVVAAAVVAPSVPVFGLGAGTVQVDSLAETREGFTEFGGSAFAQSFATGGSESDSFVVRGVRVPLTVVSGASVGVSVWTSDSQFSTGVPDAMVGGLGLVGSLDGDRSTVEEFVSASGVVLAGDTTYWLVFSNTGNEDGSVQVPYLEPTGSFFDADTLWSLYVDVVFDDGKEGDESDWVDDEEGRPLALAIVGDPQRSVAENSTAGTVGALVVASDADGDSLTYSVAATSETDGDAHLTAFDRDFLLDASSGQISVKSGAAIDYEDRREYRVLYRVTDGEDLSGAAEGTATIDDEVTLTIRVTNVDEPGAVTFNRMAQADQVLRARVSDPDGSVSDDVWVWSKSQTRSGTFTVIAGVDSDRYTPTADDVGMFLQAAVTYDDGSGSGRTASAVTAEAVAAAAAVVTVTARELLGNVEQQQRDYWRVADDIGQVFTTGHRLSGYTVTGAAIVSVDPQGDDFDARICEVDARGLPTSVCWDLNRPPSFAAGTLVFPAPTSPALTLEASTSYALVAEVPTGGAARRLSNTASASSDSSGLRDWKFRSRALFYHSLTNVWGSAIESRRLRIRINGALNASDNADAPTAADGTVTAAYNTPYTFAAADFGFSATAGGDALVYVTILSRPAKGELERNGVALHDGNRVTRAQLDAGSVTYTPATGEYGSDHASFFFRVTGSTHPSDDGYLMTVDVSTVPMFASATVSLSVVENTTAGNVGAAITATDEDGDTLAYSVAATGETDAAQHLTAFNEDFELDAATGQVTVSSGASIDFEDRPSYKVLVQASDSSGGADGTATLTITVTDVEEPGTAAISGTLAVGQALEARVSDLDGGVSGQSWQWSRSPRPDSGFDDIDSATGSSYTTVDADKDFFLKVSASYTDRRGSGKSASGTTGLPVGVTASTLVKNTGQSDTSVVNLGDHRVFQAFTTGGNPAGYALSSVDLWLGDAIESVAILAKNPGNSDPGSLVLELANPDSMTTDAVNTFTAPAWTLLDPDTTYFIRVNSGMRTFKYARTLSADEDSGAASGWDIANSVVAQSVGSFRTLTGRSLRIDIEGFALLGAPGPPASLAAAAGQGSVALSWSEPGATGRRPVEKYQVRHKETSGSFGVWADVADSDSDSDLSDELSVTVSSLTAGTEYVFEVRAVNARGEGTAADATAIPTVQLNRQPAFPSATASLSAEENTTAGNVGAAITATDEDLDALTYSVAATTDTDAAEHLTAFNRDFELDAASGQVTVKGGASIDFEGRPSYKVLVQVSDGKDSSFGTDPAVDAETTLTITVTDVEEPGTVAVSGTLSVGEDLSVVVSDPDGSVSGESWQWSRSPRPDSGFDDINSATGSSYTTVDADKDFFLRASASYSDRRGSGKSASGTTGLPVGVTADTLVKNTGQGSTGSATASGTRVYQAFTTGDNPAGYVLSSVDLWLATDDVIRVEIEQNPQDTEPVSVAELANPDSMTHNAANTFTAPAGTVLAPDTTYFLRVFGSNVGNFQYARTESAGEDSGAASGWSIADEVVGYNLGTFTTTQGRSLRIDIEGFALLGAPGPPASLAAAAGGGSVELSWSEPGSTGRRPVTKYQVHHRETGESFGEWADVADSDSDNDLSDELSVTVSGLTAGTRYVFEVRAVNARGDGTAARIPATPTAVSITAPVFAAADYPGGAAARTVAENTTSGDVGLAVTATDADGDSLTYSVAATGDSDAADHLADFNRDFELDTATGQVSVKAGASIDFEDRSSYVVSYRVTDGEDAAGTTERTPVIDDTVTLTVSVTNVDEPGAVVIEGTPQVGEVLTASLSDPDVVSGTPVWQWSKAATMSGSFTAISSAMSAAYTVLAADEGEFLKATATYTDGFDAGRSASATSAVVAAAAAVHTVPAFSAATEARSVAENTTSGDVGLAVTATDADGDSLTYSVAATGESDAADHLADFNLHFDLDTDTGQVSVKAGASIDFEDRSSYKVLYRVTDGEDAAGDTESVATVDDMLTLTVTVTDVDEPGTAAISGTLSVGEALTASVADPDVDTRSETWAWSRSPRPDTGFTSVGTSSAMYTTVADDDAFFLRAGATYSDRHGSGKSASATTELPVGVTASTQVKNTGQGSTGTDDNGNSRLFQGFTTGDNPAGYVLSSVGLRLSGTDIGAVELHAKHSSNSNPGSRLAGLEDPDSKTANAVNTFTAPAGTVLEPNTTYFVAVSRRSGATVVPYAYTASDSEDSGAASGWSIASNALSFNSPNYFALRDQILRIDIRGFDLLGPPGPVATFTATPGEGSAALSWTAPASTGRRPVTKYQVRHKETSEADFGVWADVADSDSDNDLSDELSVTVSGLTGGTDYTFEVRAVNARGDGTETDATATPTAVSVTSTRELVSNIGQGERNFWRITRDVGQGFTTGYRLSGYTVSDIAINSQDPQGDAVSAKICEVNSSDVPTAVCTDLTPPRSFASGNLVFTAPTNPALTLATSTSYILVMDRAGSGGVRLGNTASGELDSSGLRDWGIRSKAQFSDSGGRWSDASGSRLFLIRINGSVNTSATVDAPTAADGTVTAVKNMPYTFTADDFGFSATAGGDALASVSVLSLPAMGELGLDGVAVTAGDSVTRTQLDGGDLTYTPVADRFGSDQARFFFRVTGSTHASDDGYLMTVDVLQDLSDNKPSVRGSAYLGEALTVDNSDVDPAGVPGGLGTLTYQWIRVDDDGESNPTDIGDGSGRYVLTDEDVGKRIKVTAGFTDSMGDPVSLTSDAFPAEGTVQRIDIFRVPLTWSGAPQSSGQPVFGIGDRYRLLVVTQTDLITGVTDSDNKKDAASYNGKVAERVGTNSVLAPYKDGFSALVSTTGDSSANPAVPAAVARDNTKMTGTGGVPIYWFTGAKVADDYPDFYDGDWDSRDPKNEGGAAISRGNHIWTGSLSDGTPSDHPLGSSDSITYGRTGQTGEEINKGSLAQSAGAGLYAVSAIFRVNSPPVAANGSVSTPEDTAYVFSAEDFGFSDTVDESDVLESVKITGLPAQGKGTLVLGDSTTTPAELPATVAGADLAGGLFTYTPPADESGDGFASFTFKVNDGVEDSAAEYTMTIDVTAVDDPGAVTFAGTPQAGEELTASVSDPDGSVSDDVWVWSKSQTRSGTFTDIAGADSESYTPTPDDVGMFLRAAATYDDGSGSGRTASAVTAEAVAAAAATVPVFAAVDYPGGAASRSVAENTTSGDVGLPVAATDADGDSLTYSVAATGDTDAAAHLAAFNQDFELDTASGQISVKSGGSIDFEDRSSYVVSYQVTDGEDSSGSMQSVATVDDMVTLTITVTNVGEAGTVTISGTPQVGKTLTASVSDPDGSVSAEVWVWSSSATSTGTFDPISGAMSASYMPVAADVGRFLKATVTYTDGFDADNASATTGAVAAAAGVAAIVLSADPSLAVVEGSSADVTVALATQPTADVTVTVTGHSGTDLTLGSDRLTFTATDWDDAQTVTVSAGEDDDTADENVALTFTAAGGGYAGVTKTLDVAVADDDPDVTVSFGSAAHSVTEGASVTVTVSLSAAPNRDVVVQLTVSGTATATTDFTVMPMSLTFGASETSKTFTVTTVDDRDDDDAETVIVSLGSPLPAGVSAGTPQSTTVTITDNDTAGIVLSEDPSLAVVEGSSADVTVALATRPTADVTVTVTGHSGTDLTLGSDRLTFTATDWAGAQTVTVSAGEDDDTADENVALTFTAAGGGYAGVTKTLDVAVADDDPDVTVSFGSGAYSVTEGASQAVTVSLSAAPNRDVVVPLAVSGTATVTTDFTGVPMSLTFGASETSQTFTVAAVDDRDDDDAETVIVSLGSPLPAGVSAGTPQSTTVTITDNDTAGIVLSVDSLAVVEGSSADVTVALATRPTADVTVTVTGHSGTDLTLGSDRLTFTATDWAGAQTVTVSAGEDDDTADENVALTFTAAGGGYAGVTKTLDVAVADDDPDVTVSFGSGAYSVTEGASQAVTVSLSAAPNRDVVVPLAVSGTATVTTDFTGVPMSLTFGASETSQTFTVAAVDDRDADDAETVIVSLGSPLPAGVSAGTPQSTTVTITDNDATVSNTAPSFTSATVARSVVENTSSGDVGGAVAATDPESDSLTYSVAATGDTDAAEHLTAFNADFELDTASGQVSVKSGGSIDYEGRTSYKVSVGVSDNKDSSGGADPSVDATTTLTVTVTDVEEAGTATISGTLSVGEALSASVSDPDGGVSGESWQWSRSPRPDTGFTSVGTSSAMYTTVDDDDDFFLRAGATYSDRRGSGKSASATTELPVGVTADTRVKNTGQGSTGTDDNGNSPLFQGFTTGDNPAGYVLSSVGLRLSGTDIGAVELHAKHSSNSNPGSRLAGLEDPDSKTANAVNTFTAPAGTVLEPNTTYFVAVSRRSGATVVPYAYTASDSEDSGAASGWSIASNALSFNSPNYFALANQILRIDIRGFDLLGPPGPVATFTATPGEESVALSWTEPGSTGHRAVTKYQVRHKETAGSFGAWADVADSDSDSDLSDELSVTVSGLTGGTDYTFEVRAVNARGDGTEAEVTATPTAVSHTVPVFSAATEARSVAENTSSGVVGLAVTATDADGDDLTYSVAATGDTDAAEHLAAFNQDFELNTASGQVSVKSGGSIDFEDRSSYKVSYRVTDGEDAAGATESVATIDDMLTLTVSVTNVDEAGTVTLVGTAQVGETVTASVSDLDGSVSAVVWQWSKASTMAGSFNAISGAMSASYTVLAADEGEFLRAAATYSDGFGAGRSANATSTVVLAAAVVPTVPVFSAATEARSVAENATSGDVGLAVTATDADGDDLTYSVAATGDTDAAEHLAAFNRDFELDTASGQVSVKAGGSIDFEDRSSYVVSYRVTDGEDATGATESTATIDAMLTLTVSVTNVDEAGTVTLSGTAQVRQTLTASVSDLDGSVSAVVWQWSKASTMSGSFNAVADAMSASYVPVAADVGEFLKATATYVDGFGSGRSASATSTVVLAAAAEPTAPAGTVAIAGTAQLDQPLTAAVSRSVDVVLGTLLWSWSRSPRPDSGFTAITDANMAEYTPVAEDLGFFLRATATYTDGGGNQTAIAATALPVGITQRALAHNELRSYLEWESAPPGGWLEMLFQTGDNPAGYLLLDVKTVHHSSGGVDGVEIWQDPAGLLYTLLPQPPQRVDVILQPDTVYSLRLVGADAVGVNLGSSWLSSTGHAHGWRVGFIAGSPFIDDEHRLDPLYSIVDFLPRMAIVDFAGIELLGPPGPPTRVSAGAGAGAVTLSWSEPGSMGQNAIVKYQVRHKRSSQPDTAYSGWVDVADTHGDGDLSDERSVTVTGLTDGTAHTLQVRAVNGQGNGTAATVQATPGP